MNLLQTYNYNIIVANESCFPKIKVLSDKYFGKNYLLYDDIFKESKNCKKHCFISLYNNDVIAFLLVEVYSNNQFIKKYKQLNKLLHINKKICIIKSICVEEIHRNKGIAHNMIKKALKNINSCIFMSFVWDYANNYEMKKILEKNKFKFITIMKEFWKSESLIKKYHCIKCGKPPCLCDAFVFMLYKEN